MGNTKLFTNKVAALNYMMATSGTTPSDMQEKTKAIGFKVNRGQAYRWANKEVSSPRLETYNAVCKALGFTSRTDNGHIIIAKKTTPHIDTTGENKMTELHYQSQLEINGLQKDKIRYLEIEIERLKDIKEKQINYPLWDDILYDVRTEQVFDDTSCTNFKSYEMKHYQDFYQRLGYSSSEAEKYWKITQKMMVNRKNKSTVEQRAFFTDAKDIPQLINFEKTDASVTSVEQVQQHFEYAIKHNVATQLQIYNTCYYKKDGSELLAVLSVLYNFTDMSSETKIKFLEL